MGDAVRVERDKLSRLLALVVHPTVPERPMDNPVRKLCYDVSVPWDRHVPFVYGNQVYLHPIRSHFQDFILACLVVNIILMASAHVGQTEVWRDVLHYQEIAFMAIFLLELLIKMVALLPHHFFKEPWHRFDFAIIVGATVAYPFNGYAAHTIWHTLRALRVVRLFHYAPRLKLIASTLIHALKDVLYVILLLVIVFSCYAILGIWLFGETRHGTVLSRHTNFSTFYNALAALSRVALGEWVFLRHDCRVSPPLCTADEDCGSGGSTPFFFTFIVATYYTIANLVVAVVMENFIWLYSMENRAVGEESCVNIEDLRAFEKEWERVDPLGRGSIPTSDLPHLLKCIGEPLSREVVDKAWVEQVRSELETLPGHLRGRVSFDELFIVLATTEVQDPDQHAEDADADTDAPHHAYDVEDSGMDVNDEQGDPAPHPISDTPTAGGPEEPTPVKSADQGSGVAAPAL